MIKLIVQVPCYNEEASLGELLRRVPKKIDGVDVIETLVINDGSMDKTQEVARSGGASHVLSLPKNKGLAQAFAAGLDECIRLGADIIVNIDADLQYRPEEISLLIAPILKNKADIVVGERPIDNTQEFSHLKRCLQKAGSAVVRMVSRTNIPDAPSGFRAIARSAAKKLNIYSDFSYTLEMIIQAGQQNIAITSVPIHTDPVARPSRLYKNMPSYIWRSAITMVRIFITYRPTRFFLIPGSLLFLCGSMIGARFLYLYFFVSDQSKGHIQSLILAAIFLMSGFFLIVTGLVAELIAANRRLMEKIKFLTYDAIDSKK